MTVPRTTIWDIEPHTLARDETVLLLGCLVSYLETNRRIVYVDGFGLGRYTGGEVGSPIIALQEALKNSSRLKGTEIVFLFVDDDADRIAQLITS